MKRLSLVLLAVIVITTTFAETRVAEKPRIIVSTDIGGTDPDDNQSMAHLLMYSDLFDIEGLVSSPSYGEGSKEEILRMIDLYEQDYPTLKAHVDSLMSPDALRAIAKQGRKGGAPFRGYNVPTEGSEWIIQCARKNDARPLYVLVWGALEDVAQTLHDAPDIKDKIRVYWIGGPNKKWGVNAYAYIAEHHPDLWFIENNATYRGIITDNKRDGRYDTGYYDYAIRGAGHLGEDFIHYYDGLVKMGDTPSLLYMMDGDPADPEKDCWGGRFERFNRSTRYVFNRQLTATDTIVTYSIVEIWMDGPMVAMETGTPCLTLTADKQDWEGYYMGNGRYLARYCPKGPGTLPYTIKSDISGISGEGTFTIITGWPGAAQATDYTLGANWFTDCSAADLYVGKWQGMATQLQWREAILEDWAKRWTWLK